MPALIPVVISVAGTVGALAAYTTWGIWAMGGILLATNIAAGVVSNALADDIDLTGIGATTGDQGLKVNSRGTETYLKILYGQNQIGGNDVFIEASGESNEFLWVVQTLGEGVISGFAIDGTVEQLFLDDLIYTEYAAYIEFALFTGTSDQEYIDQALGVDLSVATSWDDNLRNTAYIIYKLTYDVEKMPSFPTRTLIINGKLLYDFRDESTEYSRNGVLALYDYLTNTRYGLGLSASQIDTTSWTAAANYVDSKNWTFDMAFSQNDSAIDIIDTILAHIRCGLYEYDGKFYLKYCDLNDEASVMTLTDDDIINADDGKSTIILSEPSQFEKPDGLELQFVDPTKNYNVDSIQIGDANGYIKPLRLLGCSTRNQLIELGYYYLERDRLNRVIKGTFVDRCAELEPHDIITFSCSWLGISNQTMRVISSTITEGGYVSLQMIYESYDLYNTSYDYSIEDTYVCDLPYY